FVRNGFFVRSPMKYNGAEVGEAERRKYEEEYLRRAERRDRQFGGSTAASAPTDNDSIIRQARQPQFVSSAYFLRFRFEEGKYAFVGRETLDGLELLRIEYYPTRLFNRERRWTGRQPSADD